MGTVHGFQSLLCFDIFGFQKRIFRRETGFRNPKSRNPGIRNWSDTSIGSVRTIEREVLWRNGVNNGQTDLGVKINYMVDRTYRSSLTDVRSNIYIIQFKYPQHFSRHESN